MKFDIGASQPCLITVVSPLCINQSDECYLMEKLKFHLVVNLGHNLDLVKSTPYMAEVLLNQDSILDLPKCPHILSI